MPVIVVPTGMFGLLTVIPTVRFEASVTAVTVLLVAVVPVITALTSGTPTAPVLEKLTAPEPDASSVAPSVPTEKPRVVVAAAPVYWSVPPLIVRFEAADDALPSELSPSAIFATDNVV